jgi:hypothetical protein
MLASQPVFRVQHMALQPSAQMPSSPALWPACALKFETHLHTSFGR